MTLTAVFQQVDNDWIAYVEEISGVNTQGETFEEAKENLIEAIQLIIEANREIASKSIKGKVIKELITLEV